MLIKQDTYNHLEVIFLAVLRPCLPTHFRSTRGGTTRTSSRASQTGPSCRKFSPTASTSSRRTQGGRLLLTIGTGQRIPSTPSKMAGNLNSTSVTFLRHLRNRFEYLFLFFYHISIQTLAVDNLINVLRS